MLPFSKIAVENYVFGHLEDLLYGMYRLRNIESEKHFQEKRTKILESYTIK
jgi:hypothetical protein